MGLFDRIIEKYGTPSPTTEPETEPEPVVMLDYALVYAELGLKVFPCRENGDGGKSKAPYFNGGFKDATTDPDQIRAW